eukprot:2662402-Amphidinium_carterae.2
MVIFYVGTRVCFSDWVYLATGPPLAQYDDMARRLQFSLTSASIAAAIFAQSFRGRSCSNLTFVFSPQARRE